MKYLLLSIIVLAVPAVANAGDYVRVKQRPFYPGPNAPRQLLADIELTHCCEKKDELFELKDERQNLEDRYGKVPTVVCPEPIVLANDEDESRS